MDKSPASSVLLCISISSSLCHGIKFSLKLLQERIDVKAFNSDGSYHKLSALLDMTSDRTKVGVCVLLLSLVVTLSIAVACQLVDFQPHTILFI